MICILEPSFLNVTQGRIGDKVRKRTNTHGASIDLCARVCSIVSDSLKPMNYRPPISSVHGDLRQEYWTGSIFPRVEHLPNPGTESASPVSPALQSDSSPAEPSYYMFEYK